ncbi:hypothetical protein BUALT_Bualt16G0119000 [Buddleja alternifolia]|uniref:Glycosyltransferase N-terminal domain-containing protein n=1 Tax=Buddleja alternifolia TaxID=168488 RepID=A0AAV6WCT8_9LAMI|nr:hypothetical protein BUALT_Bualt16G0119000 [Buddleja alternifolia]
MALQGFFSGDIYNLSREIEGLYLNLLKKEKSTGAAKAWALGPFNPISKPESKIVRHECLDWLDKQEPGSVIFVSFGTTSSLLDEQVKEIAIGLESSGQKFIWVLRDADKGNIFEGEARKPELPIGFEERVREKGIVVRDWAPELEILGHLAIATWSMHSDQPRNAVLVTKVLKTGVEVREWELRDELVSSMKIEKVVRMLMDSKERVGKCIKIMKLELLEGTMLGFVSRKRLIV